MIHLQEHYYTILTFGTKYKSLYRNDHTIYTNTLNNFPGAHRYSRSSVLDQSTIS